MRLVFRGPLPDYEAKRVSSYLASLGVPSLSRDQFADAVAALQAKEESTPMDMSKTAHYSSYGMLRDHKLKDVRPEVGPPDVLAKPLTGLSEVGWRATEAPVGFVRCPKKQCEETKFMGALFKAGVI